MFSGFYHCYVKSFEKINKMFISVELINRTINSVIDESFKNVLFSITLGQYAFC